MTTSTTTLKPRRKISAAGRRNMSLAQRRRHAKSKNGQSLDSMLAQLPAIKSVIDAIGKDAAHRLIDVVGKL